MAISASRQLLLLRHGRPRRPDFDADPRLALERDDKRAAQRHGARLACRGRVPDLVLAAPDAAAGLAAEKAGKSMGLPVTAIRRDERLAQTSRRPLLELLAEIPTDVERVLLVADRAPLQRLMRYLVGKHTAEERKLRPSTMARLALPGGWTPPKGSARLRERIADDDLPRRFPFPFPDGPERRRRPAYFYRQSAAIPFRQRADGELEVLLISSCARKHWGVPKGVVEPGFTLADSAAREAHEEAGVEGRMLPEPIGRFDYRKWGATCVVETYALEVERELDGAARLEPHRDRAWFPQAEAASRVKAPGLAALIRTMVSRFVLAR